MARLGYKRYVAQGGDWGAYVTTAVAQQRPLGLVAIHLNFPQVIPDRIPAKLSPEQKRAMGILNQFLTDTSRGARQTQQSWPSRFAGGLQRISGRSPRSTQLGQAGLPEAFLLE